MPVQSSFTTQLKFAHALSIVRAIPPSSPLQPIAADKLRFYGLYKQATEGDVNIPKPSSRQVVEYAKWKSWSRMKGLSPIEAQKLYVESLVQLLNESLHRYPNNEQSSFIRRALDNLQFDNKKVLSNSDTSQEEEDLFLDAYDPTEFELQEHFLNNIQAEQVMQEGILNSPPTSQSSSFIQYNPKYFEHRHSSVISPITSDFPPTPITSPGQNTITGQWVLNQLQQHNKTFVHPMDFLQDKQNDVLSEPDTIDREVAAATANLSLSSPRQSPYSTAKTKTSTKPSQELHTSSASTSTSSRNKKEARSNRAFEQLQTEVTALTEQIDRLRRTFQSKEEKEKQLRWSTMTLVKVLLKHILANSAILLIAFYILWKKKSPIAYTILGHITPFVQEWIQKLLRRIVFWKVTV